jgi:CRISPR-associated endonuclease/helicase Cas3
MLDELRTAFCQLFGVEKAYDFQVEVAQRLLFERKSVILQAPTGSGKTWTALFPFLHAWQTNQVFPHKCLYAVPLRVLTEQFKDVAEQVVATWSNETKPSIRLQTGEQQGDPLFEGDLIFTTIDQVLSSALSIPYSLSSRQANMNAGAVFSSFLVCDELHLFPIDERNARGALATLIELLRAFGDAFPFLLMTATFSDHMLKVLEHELGVAQVKVSEAELSQIESQQKIRRYRVVPDPLSAQAVLAQHRTRSIAICNQVERAIDLYDALCQEVEGDPLHRGKTEVQLLHSHFIKRHREQKETAIRQQFKKYSAEHGSGQRISSLIVVATQAIEVGLDITCEQLHTELAPANAIIQRAGRCARYKNEEGDVHIYRLPDDTKQPHLPYDAARCDTTWTEFSQQHYNGQPLSFSDEQRIVSAVHDPSDEKLITKILQESYGRWLDMDAAIFRGEKEGRARLIRKVDSRMLLVHDNPPQILTPYAWRGFSLFQGTLRGWIKELREKDEFRPWMIQFPVEIVADPAPDKDDPLKDVKRVIEYSWERVTHEGMIDLSPVFVVHSSLVSYDEEHGFRLKPAEQPLDFTMLEQEPPVSMARQYETRYALEDYAEHIGKMLSVYRQQSTLARQLSSVAQRLSSSSDYSVTVEQIERAVLLAIALHDVGKLQVEWQKWSHAYQQAIHEPQPEHKMIVHTHFMPQQQPLHKQAEEALRQQKRPPHAAEGAWASWPIIVEALDGDERLSKAVFTAITRHHSSFASTIEPYILHQYAQEAIGEALTLIGLPTQFSTRTTMQGRLFVKEGALDGKLLDSGDIQQWLIYTLIVRALRLCDGKSLEGL